MTRFVVASHCVYTSDVASCRVTSRVDRVLCVNRGMRSGAFTWNFDVKGNLGFKKSSCEYKSVGSFVKKRKECEIFKG